MPGQYIVDTHAWVEYFRGSDVGRKVKSIIESGVNITPTIVLAEIKRKYVDWKRTDFEKVLGFIHSRTEIVPLDEPTALLAGEIRAMCGIAGIGIVDSILLALSKQLGAKVLTGDPHFKGVPEAEYVGE